MAAKMYSPKQCAICGYTFIPMSPGSKVCGSTCRSSLKRARDRRYYEENREKVLAQNRRYRKENKEKVLAQNRRRYDKRRAAGRFFATVTIGGEITTATRKDGK